MLSDIERKVHRILVNYSKGRRRLPSIHELEIKTGRGRAGVFQILATLSHEGYIAWSMVDPEQIQLLKESEPTRKWIYGWK
ncbi:hypothetical protein ACFQI7_27665 [Paenibacillus allorhizosphaerae]|uniref:LexA repressor DNA-binding domain-containing protein n=1 Tax=Paenibacillus allorhizosphaerae TaxID=2849866 RepID=A0ABM8VUE3_9BACL|nr:hypothetical protein [Paenibacillus allorhizosphaerae]CAG7658889.1 hypothetical protein PAECIP111802_07204 [Paenibacillus allorhizosphaerae]